MSDIKLTQDQIARGKAAAIAVHDMVCPKRSAHEAAGCVTTSNFAHAGIVIALEHLDANPRDVAEVRGIFHDRACMSGCSGRARDDHAWRTQAKVATSLRKYHATEAQEAA